MKYAKASKAFGFCDRTGFRYPLNQLVTEMRNGIPTGFRVGKDVVDADHPQNFLGRVAISDPQSLLNPRPDRAKDSLIVSFPNLNQDTLDPQNSPAGLSVLIGSVTINIT